jgi:hypothetical protein
MSINYGMSQQASLALALLFSVFIVVMTTVFVIWFD